MYRGGCWPSSALGAINHPSTSLSGHVTSSTCPPGLWVCFGGGDSAVWCQPPSGSPRRAPLPKHVCPFPTPAASGALAPHPRQATCSGAQPTLPLLALRAWARKRCRDAGGPGPGDRSLWCSSLHQGGQNTFSCTRRGTPPRTSYKPHHTSGSGSGQGPPPARQGPRQGSVAGVSLLRGGTRLPQCPQDASSTFWIFALPQGHGGNVSSPERGHPVLRGVL